MSAIAVALVTWLQIAGAAHAAGVTAFVHINVVPMDREQVLRDQTVLVDKGVIAAVGRNVKVPGEATIIDGHQTAFLSPGLADMHSHSETRNDMKLYLANGVTTILHMGSATSDFMDQRVPLLNRGERPGPHIYAAFRIDGTPEYGQFLVKTPEQGRWITRLAKANGYSYIKVYNNLSPDVFAAVVEEARRQGMAVVGHHLEHVGLEKQLDQGQVMVAHLEEFFYSTFASTQPAADPLAAPDEALIPAAITFLRRDHGYVTADLHTFETIAEQWGRPEMLAKYLGSPEGRLVTHEWRLDWSRSDFTKRSGSLRPRAVFLAHFVKALSTAGVGLIPGTDAPTLPGIVPGYSLHDDLASLERSGLTRFQVLSAATRASGEFVQKTIGDPPFFGQVRPGFRADLIMSDANPLDDLDTLRQPRGVMSHGRWYDEAQLTALVGEVLADAAR